MNKLLFNSSRLYIHRKCFYSTIYSLKPTKQIKNPFNTIITSRQLSLQSISTFQLEFFKSLSESTPVAVAQNYLIDLHDFTGLPWWGTIMLSTILLRTLITVPLALYQNYIMAKVQNLALEMPDIVKELKMETAVAIKKFNWTEKQARAVYNRSLKKQWNRLIVRDNCHPFKASTVLWVQIPMWVCLSVALRNLVYMLPNTDINAQILFTEMTIGGVAWIPNLTVPDASWILPVLLGIANLAIIEIQTMTKIEKKTKLQRYATNFFRVVSIAMVPIAATVPSCMSLYWTTSSIFGLGQNLILMSPKVKRFARIPSTTIEIKHPYQHLWMEFKNRIVRLRK